MTFDSLRLYVLIPCFLLLVLSIKHKKKLQDKRLPPGPRRLPLIGNMHQIKNPLHKTLQNLAEQHGDLMFLLLGSVPVIVISSSEIVRDIFKSHDVVFSGRPVLHVAKKFSYNYKNITFSSYGDYWREVKKLAILELLSIKRVQSFQAIRKDEVSRMIDSIAHSSGPINLSELTFVLSNSVMSRVAFGKKYDDGTRIQDLLEQVQNLVASICIRDYFPMLGWLDKLSGLESRLDSVFKELDRFYGRVIEDHQNSDRPKPEYEDLVDVLLRLQDDPNRAFDLTVDTIKSLLTDTFIAGTDTSAATLVWTMTELIQNPSVMKKAQEEIRRVVKGKGKVEESDLPELLYLKLVLKESLRMHPPAPLLVPRETIDDCTIKGYNIPAKTRVFINALMISMDSKSWDNPKEFRPERFMDNSIDYKGQHFELIPFGAGRRGCPGITFGVSVIELALANLLYHFEWELPPGVLGKELDMEEALGITMHKKIPLHLLARPFKM